MCTLCFPNSSTSAVAEAVSSPHARDAAAADRPRLRRRAALALGGVLLSGPVLSQVEVGNASRLRNLVPAEQLEQAAVQEYQKALAEARQKGTLVGQNDPQLRSLRNIAQRLVVHTAPWNARVAQWRWEVNLIRSDQVNAWCMPGGKIMFYTGLLNRLRLSEDEVAMIMGHEMAHALREHAREQMAKQAATGAGISIVSSLFGLGELGNLAANMGAELLALKFSRNDETEADLVGLEIAARAGYNPRASVTLWQKMMANAGGQGGFLSTHPSGPDRIRQLEANISKVQGLYERSSRTSAPVTSPQRVLTPKNHAQPVAPDVAPSNYQTPIGDLR